MMKSTIFNWLRVIIGILAAILFLEIGLRLLDFGSLKVWSSRTIQGRQIYYADPQIGWRLKPNLQTFWTTREGYEVPVETNSHGLRDREHAYTKEPGVYRVLLLGDSFVEGLQLPLVDIFPTTLESCLSERLGRPVEVINGGTTAYSVGDKYLYYINEGYKYDPDFILVGFFSEYALLDLDRQDDQMMVRIAGAYRFDLEDNELKKSWLSWITPEKEISTLDAWLRKYSLVYQTLWHPDARLRVSVEDLHERLTTQLGWVSGDEGTLPPWNYFVFAADFSNNPDAPDILIDRWQVFRSLFEEFQTQIDADHRDLAVFIIPNKYQSHHSFRDERILELSQRYSDLSKVRWDLAHEPNLTFGQYFQQQDVPVLDLLPYFQTHDADNGYSLYFNSDLHFNREGHYMTRDLLCEWLVDTQLVSQ